MLNEVINFIAGIPFEAVAMFQLSVIILLIGYQ